MLSKKTYMSIKEYDMFLGARKKNYRVIY